MDAKTFRVLAGVGIGIAMFHAGSVAGYFYAKSKLTAKYDEMLQEEVQKTREYYKDRYKKLNKAEEFGTPEAAAQHIGLEVAAGEALASYRGNGNEVHIGGVQVSDATIREAEAVLEEVRGKPVTTYHGVIVNQATGETIGHVDDEPTMIQRNVFSEPPSTGVDFAYEDEIRARRKDRPYIISEQEWDDNDHNHEQVEMTYYEQDRTVADPNDKPVALVDETIGWDNLERFGHRSNDDNVVYVRHETYTLDMMITRDHRSYGEVVGGFTPGQG